MIYFRVVLDDECVLCFEKDMKLYKHCVRHIQERYVLNIEYITNFEDVRVSEIRQCSHSDYWKSIKTDVKDKVNSTLVDLKIQELKLQENKEILIQIIESRCKNGD